MTDNIWKIIRNMGHYQVARQIRPLRCGEPFHSGVIETQGWFDTRAEAQELADKLNRERYVRLETVVGGLKSYNTQCDIRRKWVI